MVRWAFVVLEFFKVLDRAEVRAEVDLGCVAVVWARFWREKASLSVSVSEG